MDSEAIKDLVENISQSVDNQIYLLREGLRSQESALEILKCSKSKLNSVNEKVESICSEHIPDISNMQKLLFDSYNNLNDFKVISLL